MGMVADRGSDIIRSTPVDGTLEERNVRTSIWERPHKITFVGTTDLPFGFRLGVTYIGMSGQPYTYVSQGDPNADGLLPRAPRAEVVRGHSGGESGLLGVLDVPKELGRVDLFVRTVKSDDRHSQVIPPCNRLQALTSMSDLSEVV